MDVWITKTGLWYSMFPVFIYKEFFVHTELSCQQHEANLSQCIMCAFSNLMYLFIKYSVNLTNIGFTYVK